MPADLPGSLTKRDGTWVCCGNCGRERTATGDEKLGPCPCGGGMTIAYEPSDFTFSERREPAPKVLSEAIVGDARKLRGGDRG